MTLNITVLSRRCIYQSADYRLIDWPSGKAYDFETQKIVLASGFGWNATVCFAGVGRTPNFDVSEWLAERIASIQLDDPFKRLIDELLLADEWLSSVPTRHRSHSFSIGAFVGSQPTFVLISNFEQLFGPPNRIASASLSVHQIRPKKPQTFIAGQKRSVSRDQRNLLARIITQDPDPQQMFSALIKVNREVAARNNLVSEACFSTYVRLTGESGGRVHGTGNRPFYPAFIYRSLGKGLDKLFGSGQVRIAGVATMRFEATEEYHRTQLREKPKNPEVHSNYGAFLQSDKGDLEGAERMYRKALQLDGHYVNAQGNLANLLWRKGEIDQATILYRNVLKVDPGNENVSWNYASFLIEGLDNYDLAWKILNQGIVTNPESGRLLLLRAQLGLRDGNYLQALEDYRSAREKRADQAKVEGGYAIALQLTDAPIGQCIAQYRVALALIPDSSGLRLNLAQLLFIKGEDTEANKQLQEAMKLGLDDSAQLEAQFYLLCHTSSDPKAIFHTIKALLSKGTRLNWDVEANIEVANSHNQQRTSVLRDLSEVMSGKRAQVTLDQLLASWLQASAS